MFGKLKNLISGSSAKSIAKWVLIVLGVLLIVWGVRSCTSSEAPRKTLYRIGRDSSWYPMQLLGKEKNLVAFTNEIVANIASENHLRFEWVESNPNSLVNSLESGAYDFILSSMRPNIVNQEEFVFSELVYEFGPVLIVRQDSKVTSLGDMKGKTIGIPSGFSPIFNAVRIAGAHSYDLLVVTYSDMFQALNALSNDLIDGVIMPAIPAYSDTLGLHAGKLKVVTAPLTDEGIRFIAMRNAKLDEIIDIINAGLKTMRSNGTYNALIAKWDLIDPETGYWHPPKEQAP